MNYAIVIKIVAYMKNLKIKLFAYLLLWYYVVFQGQNKYLYSHLSNKCTEYNKKAGG